MSELKPAHLNMLDAARAITRGQASRMTDDVKRDLAVALLGHCVLRWGDKMPDEIGSGRIAVVSETIRAFALIADHIPGVALEFAARQMGIAGEGVAPMADLIDDVLSDAGLGNWVIWRPDPGRPECRFTTVEVYDRYLENLLDEGDAGEIGVILGIFNRALHLARSSRAKPVVVRRIYDNTDDGAAGITNSERNIRLRLGLPTGEEVSAEEVAGMPRPDAEADPAADDVEPGASPTGGTDE